MWVNSFHSLLAVRFLAGAGLGGAMPILITLASEAVAPQNRGRAVGLMYCGMPVGAAILSLIAATEFGANWKNVFYLGGLLPIIVIPLMMLYLPESKEYLKTQNKTAAERAASPQGSFKDLFNSDKPASYALHLGKLLLHSDGGVHHVELVAFTLYRAGLHP